MSGPALTPEQHERNGAESYALVIETLRKAWLSERKPGESAEQHMARTGRNRGYFAR